MFRVLYRKYRMSRENDHERWPRSRFWDYIGQFGSHWSNRTIDGSLFAPSMNSSGVNFILYNLKILMWVTNDLILNGKMLFFEANSWIEYNFI